ncbi:probable inactive receptor kinase At5g53320 [Gastrolobium bilobum]|uniref:probable inactive receptor kinase At5g53320 n=1 Tax=Gastrolobium bilobum TaxID=150636 RepID=UPI002AAF16F3|nr:probable inactive receptor kinase At5g53320 [Gastrolobium bilobum]
MQDTRDLAMFLRKLVCFALLPFFIMVCTGGELSESEFFFNFLRGVDPKNVLNISWNGSASNPCLVKLNGVRCNSNATNIVEIRLENLNLTGIIDADSLCRLKKLRVVSLAKNNIRGTIPHSILQCTRLMHLNVTSNQLSGRVPKALTKLKYLKSLDISNNKFSGVIPSKKEYKRPFTYYVTPRKLESNKEGYTNTNQPAPAPLSGSTPGNAKKPWYFHWEALLVLILGIGLVFPSIYFAMKMSAKLNAEGRVMKSHRVSPIKKATTEIQEVKQIKEGDSELVFFVEDHERFTLEDLLRATADLQSESFSSSLYKVKLDNNVHYAVKRLKNLQVSSDEFGETLKQISNLKHPNILPLVGYRSTSEEKLIIYKYQSNGSLLNLLNDYIAGRKDFSWKLRLSIACGIARGLGFIYKKVDGQEVIPHGNLKLSNILLNDNNEPLISEHGLSKFMDTNRGFLFSSQGYTAPEKSLTEKGDVYSFGVILLELLTGKSIEVSRIDLARWVRSMVREEWTGEVFDKEVRENEHQWAFPLLNIALMCVSRFQENRPTTVEILEKMEEVMDEHEQQQGLFASTHCSNGSNREDCCSLHQIIPDTWDSPGSNY